MDVSEIRVVIASDVSDRDGIGVELYHGDEMLMVIFRDDTKREREVTLYRKDLPLNIVEYGIRLFKSELPWDYIEDE